MSVALLLITHGQLGSEMLARTEANLGSMNLPVVCHPVDGHDDPEHSYISALKTLNEINAGDGVIVVSDLCGATPGNIGQRLADGNQILCLHGLNMAMLVRAQNYPALPLFELAERMLEGGRRGIVAGSDSQ